MMGSVLQGLFLSVGSREGETPYQHSQREGEGIVIKAYGKPETHQLLKVALDSQASCHVGFTKPQKTFAQQVLCTLLSLQMQDQFGPPAIVQGFPIPQFKGKLRMGIGLMHRIA